ncbi:alpha/beta fold hydrolase [Mycolicibacterium chubuense]|uniref:Alpha/beta hydrolase family protein n=1 Tax=Mycolicibacterium chubuense TaxID=1800 RepID=A0A0J6ZJ81_MYCCU|nr:alpha/beta hydrolase [Mycolicibacterium chubuense]KMO84981.1 Alpha/beta hydrolase family protein [Mycolicibacterium chubuense]SPX95555.1 putative hydrolase or acyltransferase of alpha/beta superfamily [Mycolicibacterium chubuense]
MTWRRIAALVALLLSMSGGARASGDPGDVRPGPVDIGGGRTLFLNCQGEGGPTVFIIPGMGSYAEAWNYIVAPDDPSWSSPYDVIEQARLIPSPDATQPTVARATRVCAYDRPDTRPDGDLRSTPVPQPHQMQQDVDDVVALIAAAGLPGPFVFVGHSYGGLILDLLARQHPDLVSGLVFAEPTSEFLPSIGSPAQNAAFYASGREGRAPGESVWFEDAFAAVASAPRLPQVPAIVLSADRFPPPDQLTPDNYTQAQIHRANDMLAAALGTAMQVVPGSGHNVMLYQPAAVADAVLRVVDAVRAGR